MLNYYFSLIHYVNLVHFKIELLRFWVIFNVDMMMARKTIVFLVRYLFIGVRGSG